MTGAVEGVSATFNNSMEIVEFFGNENTTYKVEIVKAGANPDNEPDMSTFFGLAWKAVPLGS